MTAIPHTIDAYIARAERCPASVDVLRLLDDEVAREGYESLLVASCNVSGEQLTVLYSAAPGSNQVDEARQRLGLREPYSVAPGAPPAFSLLDVPIRSGPAAAVLGFAHFPHLHSASGELTIPFHRSGDMWDIVSMRERDGMVPRGDRHARVKLKAYATVQRLAALDALAVPHDSKGSDHPCAIPCSGNSVCAVTLSDKQCRAIALVDVSWRRYNAGLLELNRRVPSIVGEDQLDVYLGRGLIKEEADDLRFSFVFRPTRVGESHLRTCPKADAWRREVWSKYVKANERPSDEA